MKVVVDSKAKVCPGVDRILALVEEGLGQGATVYAVGELIHNPREIARLEALGLKRLSAEALLNAKDHPEFRGAAFLVRAHGESPEILGAAKDAGMRILDGTCPIVKHSQELVSQHAREGWRIVVAGKGIHAEVTGLLGHARGMGVAVESVEEAETVELESRTLLLAQTTIDPDLFTAIRQCLVRRMTGLKVQDTTCRFIRNRRKDVETFAREHDAVVLIGGVRSSNSRLLYETAKAVNPRTQKVQSPEEVDWSLIADAATVGITSGASTPAWQIEELRDYLENRPTDTDNNPQGLKNTKGGNILWRIWKGQSKTA